VTAEQLLILSFVYLSWSNWFLEGEGGHLSFTDCNPSVFNVAIILHTRLQIVMACVLQMCLALQLYHTLYFCNSTLIRLESLLFVGQACDFVSSSSNYFFHVWIWWGWTNCRFCHGNWSSNSMVIVLLFWL
jgi:hypothetical protein